jgi:hypothetical protein
VNQLRQLMLEELQRRNFAATSDKSLRRSLCSRYREFTGFIRMFGGTQQISWATASTWWGGTSDIRGQRSGCAEVSSASSGQRTKTDSHVLLGSYGVEHGLAGVSNRQIGSAQSFASGVS